MKLTIGITGGIGSGKSVVARICRGKGIPVYDCDLEAKKLMDGSERIKRMLTSDIDKSCVSASGEIDRARLGEIVFQDSDKLMKLNEIVHREVREHFNLWRDEQKERLVFVETAIPSSSRFEDLMDQIWLIEAPHIERVRRVMQRSSITMADVEKRIKAQDHEFENLSADKLRRIDNGGAESLLLQIEKLLNEL